MTTTDILAYIDGFLDSNGQFVAGNVIDFALDMRSFVLELDRERADLAAVA